MDKSSSGEGFWGGGGRTSSIKEIWKQGSQACLEKEQVVLTGWSMGVGVGGSGTWICLAISAGYGPKGKSFERRNQNVRTSGF